MEGSSSSNKRKSRSYEKLRPGSSSSRLVKQSEYHFVGDELRIPRSQKLNKGKLRRAIVSMTKQNENDLDITYEGDAYIVKGIPAAYRNLVLANLEVLMV